MLKVPAIWASTRRGHIFSFPRRTRDWGIMPPMGQNAPPQDIVCGNVSHPLGGVTDTVDCRIDTVDCRIDTVVCSIDSWHDIGPGNQ